MDTTFDRIVIAVPDLIAAVKDYQQLLGAKCTAMPEVEGGPQVAWLLLPNTIIELVQIACDNALIQGVVFASRTHRDSKASVANTLGLDIRLCNGALTSAHRAGHSELEARDFRVDHLVLRTTDAEECIALFGGQLGIRLALDQTVPEWGGRMLFFRTGKLTLEVMESLQDKPAADYFWGIAYQCLDLEQTAEMLSARGVTLSEIRTGRKQGSLVATVKSHGLGIPTLLIQPG